MKKGIKLIIFALACVALASCSSKNDHLEKLIPEDVAGVVCINVPNIVEKSGIKQGDDLVIPDELKAVISKNDDSTFGQIIKSLPNLGIEMKDKAYVYFPDNMFDMVSLVALSDEGKAKALITHRTGEQFASVEGVDCVISGNSVFAVEDNILFCGRLTKTVDKNKVAKWVDSSLNYEGKSIADNADAKTIINPEKELTAYINMQKFNKIIRVNPIVSDWSKKYPVLQLLLDSDIKAIAMDMAFDKNKGDIDARLIMDDNCQFATLMNRLLKSPSNTFLKSIPNSMDIIASLSVNGDNLVKLPQVGQMVKMVNDMPFMGRLDLKSIIASIDGPIAVGVAQDPNFDDEYNYVFAAQSSSPSEVVELISRFASTLGQDPEIYGGEHIYSYYNKQVRVGVDGEVVYIKMLNYEQTEGGADEIPEIRDFFANNNLGVYSQLKSSGINAIFNFGLSDLKTGKGVFKSLDENGNALLQFITLLCGIEPADNYDYDTSTPMVDESSIIGDFQPL